MLKGVNKRVVEIVEPENEFFERAILFVKAEKQQHGEDALRENAQQYLGSLHWQPRRPGLRLWALRLLPWGAAAAAGAMLGSLILK